MKKNLATTKKIFALLLCAAMLSALIPSAVLAATGIYVGGTELIEGTYYLNDDDGGITETGATEAKYNVAYIDGVLNLKNANIEKYLQFSPGEKAAVYTARDLKINLINTNTISCNNPNSDCSYGIYILGSFNLTISGSGSLTVTGEQSSNNYGISSEAITIESGKIEARGGDALNRSCGITGEKITIEGGEVTAKGGNVTAESCRSYGINGEIITIKGGSLKASGGDATEGNATEWLGNGSSYGINGINLIISGGVVTATGSKADISYGAYSSNISIKDAELNATSEEAANQSYGISGDTITMQGGEVTATGGNTTEENSSTYGISGETVTIEGTQVNVTGGDSAKSNSYSYGLYGSAITIKDGVVTVKGGNTTGDNSGSYGVVRATIAIEGGSFTATGSAFALSASPDLSKYPAARGITVSEHINGTPSIGYVAADITNYKYFKIIPNALTIAGKPMKPGDYYVNGANGAEGEVYDTEPLSWNAKLELIEGKYKLTVDGLNIDTNSFAEASEKSGIKSYIDLILHVAHTDTNVGVENVNVVISSNGTAPALGVEGDLNVTMEDDIYPFVDFRSYVGPVVEVSGNMTVTDNLSALLNKAGCPAINVGGNLEVANGGSLDVRAYESDASTKGINVGGDFIMNGQAITIDAGSGMALNASGNIEVNAGNISFEGIEGALNKQPDLTEYLEYIWTVDETVYNKNTYTAYSYLASHQKLIIDPMPYATIDPVVVRGTPGIAITPVETDIRVIYSEFANEIAAGTDVSSWFTNIPDGITAKLKDAVYDGGDVARVEFSGTPTVSADKTNIEVTVPFGLILIPEAISAEAQDHANWSIFQAISNDFDLSGLLTAPVKNETPVLSDITKTNYSGTVMWSGSPAKFLGDTVYTATVTLTPDENFTFIGVEKDVFTYTGATSITSSVANENDQIIVTVTFPKTAARVLSELTTTGAPTKTLYSIGEAFDPSGLTITAKYDDGTQEAITAQTTGYSVTPAEIAQDTTSVTILYGGKEATVDGITVRENLVSITAPAEITDLVNGTLKSAVALTLPTKVSITTSTGVTTQANVTWDVDSCTYNSASKAAQNFTVDGTVTLADSISNVDDVDLAVQIAVSVNAVVPKVTSVNVSPDMLSVVRGRTQAFTASVIGTNSPIQTVTWSLSGNSASSINENGVLSVGESETATSLTITATSTYENTKFGTVTVKVLTEYPIIKGALGKWTTGGTSSLGFTADADYEKLESVEVDGELLSSDDYTTESGSTIVTLNNAFLKTLTAGRHTLRVNFTDGYSQTYFYIASDNPTTGDGNDYLLWICIAMISGIGISLGYLARKRRANG